MAQRRHLPAVAALAILTFLSTRKNLEVQGLQEAILRQGRDDLRGLAAGSGQVAPRPLDGHQLQERDQLLRDGAGLSALPRRAERSINHRIRLAVQEGTFEPMSGEVEIDETCIGGAARFMHKSKREGEDHLEDRR